jgi:hypothetical protein
LKGRQVLLTILLTTGILVVALVVIAVVAIGENGTMADRAPELADMMANTARHMSGDAEPPKLLVELFEEIPELRPSARSADSASIFRPESATVEHR